MDQDVALTKAALLYANEVEIVSLGVSMYDELRQVIDAGEYGGFDLLASLDDEMLQYLAERTESRKPLPPDWRETLQQGLSIRPEALESLGIDGADELREVQRAAAAYGRDMQQALEDILEENGATELLVAVRAGAIKVATLGVSTGSTMRPAELGGNSEADQQIWNWIDALVARLTDRKTRLLFDKQAGSLVQSMLEAGMIPSNEQGLRLAAQAALGAGFAQRLPAFPTAKMDELLDMRNELAVPLARYRGAVVRFSRDAPQAVGPDLEFEVQQLWDETVNPALAGLKEELARHGLVREIARSLDVKHVQDFGKWTAGTWFTVTTTSALDLFTTGLIATATGGAATITLDAIRNRREAEHAARTNEFYYLYEANRRMA